MSISVISSGVSAYSAMSSSSVPSSAKSTSKSEDSKADDSLGILEPHIKTYDSYKTSPSYIVRISEALKPRSERDVGALTEVQRAMEKSGEEFAKQQAAQKPKGLVENMVDLVVMAGLM